jgi:hypothetical protein
MALYGKYDGLGLGATTISSISGANVTFSATVAAYNIEPGDTLLLDPAGDSTNGPVYRRVKYIHSATVVELESAPVLGTLAGTEVAELQEAPKYTSSSDVNSGLILGASTTEAAAGITGLPHVGWVKKHTKTRGGVTSTWYETLAASSSITEDIASTDF